MWCICGCKELSDEWTSNNKKLDEFIKKSQIQTNSANDAYLEWIPFDCIDYGKYSGLGYLYGLPIPDDAALLEITDEANDSYYDKVNC